METTDYVSYPVALALKKAGFDELCRYYYNPKGMLRKAKDNALSPEALNNRYLDEIADGVCSAVSLWQAQKWLRNMKQLSIESYANIAVAWNYNIADLDNFAENVRGEASFPSYESALSAGIAAALELIENKGE